MPEGIFLSAYHPCVIFLLFLQDTLSEKDILSYVSNQPYLIFVISFKKLDFLYRNSPAAYRDLLLFMLKEFEAAEIHFRSYLEKGDSNSFNQLKHKLLSTLSTLEFFQLMATLERINGDFKNADEKKLHTQKKLLNSHFGLLKMKFSEKLQLVREECVM